MNSFKLPVQDFMHYKLGGQIFSQRLKLDDDIDAVKSQGLSGKKAPLSTVNTAPQHRWRDDNSDAFDAYKKGGKITKQKQSQRQTQIVHIHNAPQPRKRRAPVRKVQNQRSMQHQQTHQLPPVFTSVPSGYVHRPEVIQPAASALIDRLDGIERRIALSIGSQVPVKLTEASAPVTVNHVGSSSSAFTPDGKIIEENDDAHALHDQIPKVLPDTSATSATSAASAASADDDEPGQAIQTPETKYFVDKIVGGKPLYNTGLTYKTKRQSYEIALTAGGTVYLKPTNDGKWTSLSAAVKGNHISEVQKIVEANDLKYPKQ